MTMSQSSHRVYPSKRDTWIALILWATVVAMLFAACSVWVEPAPFESRLVLCTLFVVLSFFVLWLLYGTRYTITDRMLHIRSGPFHWRVALHAIQEVVPTRNPLSSPACSLDRLWIRYRGGRLGVMVSPRDKDRFLQDLATRAAGLSLVDGRLTRETS